jgi:hypothetical protein
VGTKELVFSFKPDGNQTNLLSHTHHGRDLAGGLVPENEMGLLGRELTGSDDQLQLGSVSRSPSLYVVRGLRDGEGSATVRVLTGSDGGELSLVAIAVLEGYSSSGEISSSTPESDLRPLFAHPKGQRSPWSSRKAP